jgi:hypothetical protein
MSLNLTFLDFFQESDPDDPDDPSDEGALTQQNDLDYEDLLDDADLEDDDDDDDDLPDNGDDEDQPDGGGRQGNNVPLWADLVANNLQNSNVQDEALPQGAEGGVQVGSEPKHHSLV